MTKKKASNKATKNLQPKTCCEKGECWKNPESGLTNFDLELSRWKKLLEESVQREKRIGELEKNEKKLIAGINKSARRDEMLKESLEKSRQQILEMLCEMKNHPDYCNQKELEEKVRNETKNFEKGDFVEKIINLYSKNEHLNRLVTEYNGMLDDSKLEVTKLKDKLDDEVLERQKLHESWKTTVKDLIIENNDKINQLEAKNKMLERQNEGYKASAQNATEVLENQQQELKKKKSKIPALENELKLKNDQKRDLVKQKLAFEAQIRALDAELKESKVDDCPICFEPISIKRKWKVFLPCGHRTCSDCADKISALPIKRRKCPICRENIDDCIVLQGIYES